jgi:hypothetical protein
VINSLSPRETGLSANCGNRGLCRNGADHYHPNCPTALARSFLRLCSIVRGWNSGSRRVRHAHVVVAPRWGFPTLVLRTVPSVGWFASVRVREGSDMMQHEWRRVTCNAQAQHLTNLASEAVRDCR